MGPGTIAATSTATKTSKFGFATREGDVDPIELYLQNRWLNAIHVHTGSQGCPLELSAQGVAEALRMAIEVNKRAGTQQIQHFDMGGGVPADYDSDADSREFQEYRDLIDTHASGLWEQGFRVYTEMGRSLTAKMGWTATRVEAVKESGGRRIAIGHVGADLFVRTAYQPQNWPHRISVFTHDGEPKDVAEEELLPQDVAGPLCFSGDMVAVARPLPRIEEGDIVVVHDTGAYTYSMYSRYNSRLAPAAYGYLNAGEEKINFQTVKAAETVDQVLQFWESPSASR